jgi:hypothetical protein
MMGLSGGLYIAAPMNDGLDIPLVDAALAAVKTTESMGRISSSLLI